MTQAAPAEKRIKIGDYVVTGKIGQGGIADIYKARQESLNRDVAIKVLSAKFSDDEEILRRFERESVVIGKLSHPNIVHVIDKGTAGNRYYFVMEYVDGTSLREVIDSKKIAIQTKLEMVAQVCKALDYAHKNGVIHRDIKPANILIDRQGNARVADFGIAQIVGTPDSEMTSSDMVMGTMAYMSPEQKVSSTNVDQTTDLYAIGIIIYEILLDRKPMGRFKLPSEIESSLDPRYDGIIGRCLASEPKDRFQSAVQLKNAILEIIGGKSGTKASDFSVGGVDSFVGKCRYLDTIKESRFSSTILVENKVSKKLFVIKRHKKGEAGRKEARVLASLKHENIINIFGSGGDNKQTVVVTDYAPGGSLAERMIRKYEWPKAMEIVLQIAAGLDFAHKNNVVHGNMRPSNVLFDEQGAVKLVDFGLPPHYDAAGKKNWYASPEKKRSRQADVYGLGVILHQMLADRNPTYDSIGVLRLDDIARILPEDIQGILTKMLAIRVSKRYMSLAEMAMDWDDFEERRQADAKRRNLKVEQPVPEKNSLPTWAYFAAVIGVVVVVLITLLVSGGLK